MCLGHRLGDSCSILVWFREGIVFATTSKPVLGPTQPAVQWVLGLKQLGCEADHSPTSNAKVKNVWSYTHTSTPSVHLEALVLN
jgi:hypothetical protein